MKSKTFSSTLANELFEALGVEKEGTDFHHRWKCRLLGKNQEVPILHIENGPKNVAEVRKAVRGKPGYVIFFEGRCRMLLLKSNTSTEEAVLESTGEQERIKSIIRASGFDGMSGKWRRLVAIGNMIKAIPDATADFDNRGVFSTHYLRARLFDDAGDPGDMAAILSNVGNGPSPMLESLGWRLGPDMGKPRRQNKTVSIITTQQRNLGIRERAGGIAPSSMAISELRDVDWAILTNGGTWRLYTRNVSASTTNYFEVNLGDKSERAVRYLVAIFGAGSYQGKEPKIDMFFNRGKTFATQLEEDLSAKMLARDGPFMNLVKGIRGHDMKKRFTQQDLDDAKNTTLHILYRIWFILYAESRGMLPAGNERYYPISLRLLRSRLDSYQIDGRDDDCWNFLKVLFKGIREGDPEHGLPRYNGGLFQYDPKIDDISVPNRHVVPALSNLFMKGDEAIDYGDLGVRHLGNIYESLLEITIKQAERTIMLLEGSNGSREVNTEVKSKYTYEKNDLYLVPKGEFSIRKTSASYYTPDEVVRFLVQRGLEPIFAEKEKMIDKDIKRYLRNPSKKNRKACTDRLLDIQVVDPAMGSGHFLVEALNRITAWATDILKTHPRHPVLDDIRRDRAVAVETQGKNDIIIHPAQLTDDILLKRMVMKRCIFGVDLNPLAVELARVSLWLDSFAIGVPLTYMDHHIKTGDSTVGAWEEDMKNVNNHSLDDWTDTTGGAGEVMARVSDSSDVTMDQVRSSEDTHSEYEKIMAPYKTGLDVYCAAMIDPTIIPGKHAKHAGSNAPEKTIRAVAEYARRFMGKMPDDAESKKVLDKVRCLRDRYKFFHWELEMMDAFTDARRGFDLVVGNPPWDKVKPYDDEFFPQYYPEFKSLSHKTKKNVKKKEILKDPLIKERYLAYKNQFKEKLAFYKTCRMQGSGDKDLWQLILERMFGLAGEGSGISVLIPSQIFTNAGSADMRKRILDSDIQQVYVFENRKKLFPIVSTYRFVLLTLRNVPGPDAFQAGFYLHQRTSLESDKEEPEKFHTISKQWIRKVLPDALQIPEAGSREYAMLDKLFGCKNLRSEFDDGWRVAFSSGFHKTNDADLLKGNDDGWPVLEGGSIHQFNHAFADPEFTTDVTVGIEREKRKRAHVGFCREFCHSYRIAFRDIANPISMRSIIASIVPPQRFHTNTLYSVVMTRNGSFRHDREYTKETAYLCGILNSMPFDFAARSMLQTHTFAIIKNISIPNGRHYGEISTLAAKLSVGSDEFAGFAESMDIGNIALTPPKRIHATAKLDALAAHAYSLTREEYQIVLGSFKFKDNPELLEAETADFNRVAVLKQLYGEVRKLAPAYYDKIGSETTEMNKAGGG